MKKKSEWANSRYPGEVWRHIEGTDYYASDAGRVKHVWKNGSEYVLTPFLIHGRKLYVKIHGRTVCYPKLIYETFLGPVPEGMRVVHIDHNIRNNCIGNLTIMTPEQVGKHSGWTSCIKKMKPVVCLKNRKIYPSANQAGKALGISGQTVLAYCNGQRKNNRYDIRWATEAEADQILENLDRVRNGLPRRHRKIGEQR